MISDAWAFCGWTYRFFLEERHSPRGRALIRMFQQRSSRPSLPPSPPPPSVTILLTVKVLFVHSLVLCGRPPPLRLAGTPPPTPGLRWRWEPTMVSMEWLLTRMALWRRERKQREGGKFEGEVKRVERRNSFEKWNPRTYFKFLGERNRIIAAVVWCHHQRAQFSKKQAKWFGEAGWTVFYSSVYLNDFILT